tara:strand:- start:16746 stop:18407 length:1662 start_codon:yes stop_codon:yes gene_type:complete
LKNIGSFIAVFLYSGLIFIPLFLALNRLIMVTGFYPSIWFNSLENNYISQDILQFTLFQAIFSTIVTLMIGIPIAWMLGRYRWPLESLIRTVLTLPFVIPSIIAAMGILTIIGPHGINIRADEDTWWWTLIIAHAWFNMALVIRFCEPILTTLDPSLEEQLRLLPNGQTRISRFRYLWAPLLVPSITAAACMTFVFSFTSFALVRWITVGNESLESMMATISSSAGIEGYMEFTSEMVLGASIIQFLILLISLWITSIIQRNRKSKIPQVNTKFVKTKNSMGWLIIVPALIFALLPIISVFLGSFRIREPVENEIIFRWSFDAWVVAWRGSNSFPPLTDALINSIGYAIITLCVSLPIGFSLASTISKLEENHKFLSQVLDVFTMLPFALSAAMVGLGVLLGIIKLDIGFLHNFWPLPALAHIMLTVPFVVRIFLPAIRSLDPMYDENAKVLGLKPWKRFFSVKLPLLKSSLIISTIFTLAMSLGEFGASFVVARNSDWVTLPLLIDSWRSKPMKDPFTGPASNVVATVLMLITIILFLFAERYRTNKEGGMF